MITREKSLLDSKGSIACTVFVTLLFNFWEKWKSFLNLRTIGYMSIPFCILCIHRKCVFLTNSVESKNQLVSILCPQWFFLYLQYSFWLKDHIISAVHLIWRWYYVSKKDLELPVSDCVIYAGKLIITGFFQFKGLVKIFL